MDEKHSESLDERLSRLETAVAELQSALNQLRQSPQREERQEVPSPPKTPERKPSGAPTSPEKPQVTFRPPPKKSFNLPENMRTSEFWLNKIGIGLVLFGVAFLFKYSVEQGWLTPAVRIGFGVVLGICLVAAGLRISAKRRHFSQVLTGGGIAAFYITGFAAFQIFSLVSHPVAFSFMAAATLLAFILSLRQNGPALALIGAIGGLGTPFLLFTGAGNIPGLIGYTCLVVGGTSAIFFYRSWRSLLWVSVVGGWWVYFIVVFGGGPSFGSDETVTNTDRLTVQIGIFLNWLAFWAAPLIREITRAQNHKTGHGETLDSREKPISRAPLYRHLHLLAISTPLVALGASMATWALSNQTWGWIVLGFSIFYGLVANGLARLNAVKYLGFTHALAGGTLLTFALFLLLDGNSLLFALATEASALHLIARRLSDKRIAVSAHFLSVLIGLWLFPRLFFERAAETAVLNLQAQTDLWVIGITFAVFAFTKTSTHKKVYLLLTHVALLGWLLRELSSMSDGQGYVTIAWGVYAVGLLVVGLRLNFNQLRTVAMGTLLLVVGKLFLVDLAELETIWRVLLFLGFGGLFLALSYHYSALWKSDGKPTSE